MTLVLCGSCICVGFCQMVLASNTTIYRLPTFHLCILRACTLHLYRRTSSLGFYEINFRSPVISSSFSPQAILSLSFLVCPRTFLDFLPSRLFVVLSLMYLFCFLCVSRTLLRIFFVRSLVLTNLIFLLTSFLVLHLTLSLFSSS